MKNNQEKRPATENRLNLPEQSREVSETPSQSAIYRMARTAGDNSRSITSSQVLQLQRTLGNKAVTALLQNRKTSPVSQSSGNTTIQRKVYLGAEAQPKAELAPTSVTWWEKQKGSGDRKVGNMLTDETNRFFNDKPEMINYAQNKTRNIGYLAPEGTWIRLPENKTLVLGENHSSTTLYDVVKATGASNYLYEPYTEMPSDLAGSSKRVRNAVSTKKDELNQKAGRKGDKGDHNLEKSMAKIVVGLDGVTSKIENALLGSGSADGGKKPAGYDRGATELNYFRLALLVSAKAAKYNKKPQPLWAAHQLILNKSYKEVLAGLPLAQTAFVKAIAKGDFTFDQFYQSFKDAAAIELRETDTGNEYAAFNTENTDYQASNKRVSEFEKMREFQMVQKIKAGLGSTSLVGMGDVHRGHLETLLEALPNVMVRKLNTTSPMPSEHATFVKEQKDTWKP